MMMTALNLLKTLPEISLIVWAAFAVGADLFAQLQACLAVFSRNECDTASLRRAKTLLLAGGMAQWLSCALLDLIDRGRYALGVTAFLLMADTLISALILLVVSFGQNGRESGDFFWATQFTRFQYLLSLLFCFSLWLSLHWRGDEEQMFEQLVGSIHRFAALFMFGALGAAAIAMIAAFFKNKDATSTARQILASCFFFGLILFLMEWLFS